MHIVNGHRISCRAAGIFVSVGACDCELGPARTLAIHDLKYLLSFPSLGGWGMEALVDTLHKLLPELIPIGDNPQSEA